MVLEPEIFRKNVKTKEKQIYISSNFDYKTIQSLFSNLRSLSILKLIELKENYEMLNYSTVEVNIQIQKIILSNFLIINDNFLWINNVKY